jgi:hypothetical protein
LVGIQQRLQQSVDEGMFSFWMRIQTMQPQMVADASLVRIRPFTFVDLRKKVVKMNVE